MTAEALHADLRLVSLGGWGVRSGCDNDPAKALPRIYEAVCGGVDTPETQALNDFSVWQPDAVVFNLGTNDDCAMDCSPPWPCSDGTFFRQARTAEGLERWIEDAVVFLRLVRRRNPAAVIVWAYGMKGDPLWPAIRTAVARCGDDRLFTCALPALTAQTVGARQHPGRANHKEAAKVLSDYLVRVLPKE